jgi:predicted transcriptional regulator
MCCPYSIQGRLSDNQERILTLLHKHPEWTIKQIARELKVSRIAVYRSLQRAVDRGVIKDTNEQGDLFSDGKRYIAA